MSLNSFLLVLYFLSFSLSAQIPFLQWRGGYVPQASETGGNYFEKFNLDYGCDDNKRSAGFMRGFIKTGSLQSIPESDVFFKWLNKHLEEPEALNGRVKPFYAADFGTKADLKRGENPKIIIVSRKLKARKVDSVLMPPPPGIDVEVREIWQPWLKNRCDFVVRYIVPNRVNILKIMESKKLFRTEAEVIEDKRTGAKHLWEKMFFSPGFGGREVMMRREIKKLS